MAKLVETVPLEEGTEIWIMEAGGVFSAVYWDLDADNSYGTTFGFKTLESVREYATAHQENKSVGWVTI